MIRYFHLPCLALATTSAFAVPCHIQIVRPPTATDSARDAYRYGDAEKLYAGELQTPADSPQASAGYSLSLLRGNKIAEAFAADRNALQRWTKKATLTAKLVRFGNLNARLADVTLFDISRVRRSMNFEIGGFVGFAALRFVTMQIDYSDGLVHLTYGRGHGSNFE